MGVHVESELVDGLLERWLLSERNLDLFVREFLECRLPLDSWTHRAHVGVAAALVTQTGEEESLAVLRGAIPRYNAAIGGVNTVESGYHETLTVFWVRRIAKVLRRLPVAMPRLDRVRAMVEAYGDLRRLDRAVYSFDVARSREARMRWIPPDML